MLKTFAEDLKAIREEKNISLKSISQHTRLNISVLENLENGEFNFQPQAYIRAFLKQYISCLDLDVEEVLFDYDLARSGKYKSNRPEREIREKEPEIRETNVREPEESSEKTITIELKDKAEEEPAGKEIPKTGKSDSSEPKRIKTITVSEPKVSKQPEKRENERKLRKERLPLKSLDEKSVKQYTMPPAKKSFSFSFLNSRIFRNIFMTVFVLLVLAGIYSLVNILFLEGRNENPEIIRQNFDDVVKEQEKKLLGKKTEEEILDSVKKAGENNAAVTDSISLKVTTTGYCVFFISSDSTNYDTPERVVTETGDVKTFKAAKSFYLTTRYAKNIKLSVDGKPVSFKDAILNNVKITKSLTDKAGTE
ncbi:MAG: helix-turn-helix domain-containing protein [Bacteroidetes bacterium]|nr:helix-turn-helix domain-containing protein [Bacteroidota bacterium]